MRKNKVRQDRKPKQAASSGRFYFVYAVFILIGASLMGRSIQLQVFEYGFLQGEGKSRYLREVNLNAYRGDIRDRRGEILAMSAPVMSIAVNPLEFSASRSQIAQLARYLDLDSSRLSKKLKRHGGRHFLYLKRQVSLATAKKVLALDLAGLFSKKEYKRYYPAVDSVAHVVGFTNVDGKGIDGVEMLYDAALKGVQGKKRILKDGKGGAVETVEYLQSPVSGSDMNLSIDMRMQHLTYEGLRQAVETHRAKSASAVILSVKTGEIIAMANYPAYNPNYRSGVIDGKYRNRAVTDEFEPGSTAKPFTVMAALDKGLVTSETVISTAPGFYRVGRKTIKDHRNYGNLDIAGILHHSSNVGAAKIALMMEYQQLYDSYRSVGFGSSTGSFFPGEVLGRLYRIERPRLIEQATLSYGYGMTTTTLQLARAYLVLANQGRLLPVTLEKLDIVPKATQVVSAAAANSVLAMLEGVVKKGMGGTGGRARVDGYRVAGKTGTIHKNKHGQYLDDQYISLFSGVIPASRPELVMVVMVDSPSAGDYYGGLVAAPVFSYVMDRGMRLLNIPPDDLDASGSKNFPRKGREKAMKIANL